MTRRLQDLHTQNVHDTKQGVRFTVSEAARCELLDRLLALNHQRHWEELEEERERRGIYS